MIPRRLPSAPLTDEDVNIFAHGYRDCPIPPGLPDCAKIPADTPRPYYRGIVWGASAHQDKRDADLMLFLGTDGSAWFMPKRWRRAVRVWQGVNLEQNWQGLIAGTDVQ